MALDQLFEIMDGRSTSYRTEWIKLDYDGTQFVQEKVHIRKFQAHLEATDIAPDGTDSNVTNDGHRVIESALAWNDPNGIEPPLPEIGTFHPNDTQAILITYQVDQKGGEEIGPEWWVITCTYQTYIDPVTLPAIRNDSFGGKERALEGAVARVLPDGDREFPGDAGGRWPTLDPENDLYPITNSALLPFTTPVTEQDFFVIVKLTKNLSVANWQPKTFIRDYVKRVNTEPFLEWDVDEVYMPEPPTAQEMRDKITGTKYFASIWTFWCKPITDQRPRPWNERILDVSFRRLSDDQSTWIDIVSGGQRVATEARLDGFGFAADPTTPLVFQEYQTKYKADFNIINTDDGSFSLLVP